MMSPDEVREFILGKTVQAIDPETMNVVALISYDPGDTCRIEHLDTKVVDAGVYGFTDAVYWTTYETFRDGTTNSFALEYLGPGRAQAYYDDGRRAFLLVHTTP
ncbi:MAG: hypothetical protein NXI19_13350 [Alphaproteobacteria bacterium]|nr:hypothetical protein [Alphaproteobacteria bacterium]